MPSKRAKRNFFGFGFSTEGLVGKRREKVVVISFCFFENKTKWRLYSVQRSVDIWERTTEKPFWAGSTWRGYHAQMKWLHFTPALFLLLRIAMQLSKICDFCCCWRDCAAFSNVINLVIYLSIYLFGNVNMYEKYLGVFLVDNPLVFAWLMDDSLARRIRSDQLSLGAFTPAAPAAHGRLTPTPSQRLARFTLLLQSLFQFLPKQKNK